VEFKSQKNIFISHSSKDNKFCEDLLNRLESYEVQCWYSSRDISVSRTYSKEIISALKKTSTVIVVISKHSLSSTHVLREVEYAASHDKHLICIRTDNTDLPDAFEYFLRLPNWIDAFQGLSENGLLELLQEIKKPAKNYTGKSFGKRAATRSLVFLLTLVVIGSTWFILDRRYTQNQNAEILSRSLLENISKLANTNPDKEYLFTEFSSNLEELLREGYFSPELISELDTITSHMVRGDFDQAQEVLSSGKQNEILGALLSPLFERQIQTLPEFQKENDLADNQIDLALNQTTGSTQFINTKQPFPATDNNQTFYFDHHTQDNVTTKNERETSIYDALGYGYGNNENQAKQEAADALSEQIFDKINRSPVKYNYGITKDNRISIISSIFSVPHLGYLYSRQSSPLDVLYFSAKLDKEYAIMAYKQAITTIQSEIQKMNIKTEKNQDDNLMLSIVLGSIEQHAKLQTVHKLLSGTFHDEISFSDVKQETEKRLIANQKKALSFDQAVDQLSRGINEENILILPITTDKSHEITPFSNKLHNQLTKHINSTNKRTRGIKKTNTKFWYTGTYYTVEGGLIARYSLIDQRGTTIKSNIAFLSSESYKDYRTAPLNPEMDQLINDSLPSNSSLKLQFRINNIPVSNTFSRGQEIALTIKMNEPGYYYLVAHNISTEKSYLIEIETGSFIGHINSSDVNKWVNIGEFTLQPPFGVEHLQLIAGNIDLKSSLSKSTWDEFSGYHLIADSVTDGIKRTRSAISMTGNNQLKNGIVEAFLSLPTFADEEKISD